MPSIVPAALTVDARERLRAVAGAFIGVLIAGMVTHWCADEIHAVAWLVAPIGASAVIVFAMPSSPLAQPCAVIGGNTISTLIVPAAKTAGSRFSAGRVGDVMSRQVRVAADTHHVVELLPVFSEGGHHHLPVVDADRVLVGMITQSDVVRALHRSVG